MAMSCVQGVGPHTTGHVGSLLGTRLRVDTSPSFLYPAYSTCRELRATRKGVLPDLIPQRPTCQSAAFERLAGRACRKKQSGHEGISKSSEDFETRLQADKNGALLRGTPDGNSIQGRDRTVWNSVLGGFTGLALCLSLHAGHADALELDQQAIATEVTIERSLDGQGVVKPQDIYAPELGDNSPLLDSRTLAAVESIRPVSDERSGDSLNPVLDISSESGSGRSSDGMEAGSGERKRRTSNGIAAAAAAVAGVSLVASGGSATAATAATGASLGGTAAGALVGAAGGLAATSSVPVSHAVATVASLHAAEAVGAAVAGSALAGGSMAASLGSTAALTSAAVAVGAGAATVASGAAAAAAGATSAVAGATSAAAGAASAAVGATSAAVGATSAALGATSAAVGVTSVAAGATSAVLGATSAVAGTTSAVAAAVPVASSALASAAVGASSAAVAATTSAVTSAVAASAAVPTSAVLATSLPVAVAGKAALASSGTAMSALPAVVAKSGATAASSAVTSAVTSAGAVCAPARAAVHAATSAVLEGGAAAVAAAEAHSGAVLTQSALASALASSAHHFVEGGVAGAVGATVVCPIDVVKTRMQGQETKKGEKPKYANPADCFVQILKDEGPGAFFLGLIPQLLGVAPEKAMKLTVNDLLMSVLESYIPGARLWALELFAGSGGGLAQVVFTNPMEMVKIRQQMQGPVDEGHTKKTALQIAYELGPSGLYQGSVATLLREIPSSAIFFGCYIVLKDSFPDQPFVAGCLAAAPAAFLCTPMDVVKTRMQMERKQGEATLGFLETMQKIIQDEGPKALFNGGLTRVLRVSPQFGITLAVYELLNHW